MYAVIFRAKAGIQDKEYGKTVARLRELAFDKYGCLDFVSVTEGKQEIAISYWKDEDAIRKWKQDAAHTMAQRRGRDKWYEAYLIQICEVKQEHGHNL